MTALASDRRSELIARLYDIYAETVSGYSREQFEREILGAGDTRLALFYGARDELAGFSHASIERVVVDRDEHAVFSAGVYFRLSYRGGAASALFGLGEALRFKLREPRTPLAYLTRSASPAVYRLLVTTMPAAFPHRTRTTPSKIQRIVHALGQRRGYRAVDDDAWVVQSVATPVDPARLARLRGHPDVEFYLRRNPRFADGAALLVWIPLDAANLSRGAWRAARDRLRSL